MSHDGLQSQTRYTDRPFPPYRFVPGRTPHPRRDPRGYAGGSREQTPGTFTEARWFESSDYLYGIDLYNFEFWWEAHEVWEGLWHAAGRTTDPGQLFQGLIQVAAAHLKRSVGARQPAGNLAERGISRLVRLPTPFLGLDLAEFTARVRASFRAEDSGPVRIHLLFPPGPLPDPSRR